MQGILTLIPSPIDEQNPLEKVAFDLLYKASTNEKEKSLFVIEELKIGRRRWLHFGLPRSVVEDFVLLNEHNAKEKSAELLEKLKEGKNIYLMSDGGLPAFCDPGCELVDLCHKNKIRVTSTPFAHSIALAIALSGFEHSKYVFEGFISKKSEERKTNLEEVLREKRMIVLMDTPYRLKKILEELSTSEREIFLALDLNSSNEKLHRGPARILLGEIEDFKREFILIIKSQVL